MDKHTIKIILSVAIFFAPLAASAATLSVTQSSVSVHAGDTFTERVVVSSTDQAANAISGTVSFPNDLLSVSSVTKAGSILTLWVQDPSFSNSAGTVDWSGVVPNPGYTGSGGNVFSIQFVAKKTGTGIISFASAEVLANDGNGTNILTGTNPASVSVSSAPTVQPAPTVITPVTTQTSAGSSSALLATITSATHPDQTKTYSATHVILDWTNAQGVTAVRIGYDKNKDGSGVVLYTDPISHKEIDLEDGAWYFHVSEKGTGGWGPVATFALHIDTSLPPEILVDVATTSTASSTVPILSVGQKPGPSAAWLISQLPLFLLALILLALLFWVWYLLKHGSRQKHRRTGGAHSLVHKEFGSLRDAVSSEVFKLEHAHTKRELNKEEEQFAKKIEKMIDTAEQKIEEEIDTLT